METLHLAAAGMSRIPLSVCIPTYNFGRFIGETLDSIIRQGTDEVEIVVVDGASTDDTAEVVEERRRSFPRLRYHRLDRRGGIDRDMSACIELARGEYCWLFSADDLMAPGSIFRILHEISTGSVDVFICGLMICDLSLNPLYRHPVFSTPGDTVFDLSAETDYGEYFRCAETTTAFFSFMSSLVVRREKLLSVPLDEDFVGSCWAHVVRIFRMMPAGLRVKYVSDAMLLKRSENDSFMEKGLVHRAGIAIDGFDRIAATLFGKDRREAFHMRRVLRNEYHLAAMLYMKLWASEHDPGCNLPLIRRLAGILYGDPGPAVRARKLVFQILPPPVLKLVHRTFQAIR